MSDAISVQCPECSAKLKLKNRSAVGKKIPCPKCKTPFVVELPAADDEFANLVESDDVAADEPEDDAVDSSQLPPARSGRSSSKKTPKKRRAGSGNWQKPVIVGGTVVAVLALLGGVGFVVFPLLAELLGGNKIDMAWLPPDSEMVIHARVADTWNAPFVKSMMSAPAVGQALNVKELLGLEPEEIRSVTFGVADVAQQGRGPGFGAGLPGMNPAGLAAARRNAGTPRALAVLRTTQSFDPKAMQNKLRGNRTVNYQQRELIYVGGVALNGQVCFFPDSKTVVMGSEAEVKAAVDRGPKAPRREDLDFIDAGRHVIIVVAPKDAAAFESSAPSSPIPLPGVSNLGTALKGKVKGICLGLSFGDDLDWSAAANCTTPDAAKEASAEIGKSLESAKGEFNKLRSSAPPQLTEIVLLGDTMLNSIVV